MDIHRPLKMISVFVLFLYWVQPAFAFEDISHTKHNLAANPDIQASNGTFNLNGDICVFCHTPHGGRTDVAGGAAPLWNRRLDNPLFYTPYDSPNFKKTGLNDGQPKGASLSCLSCHDGTIAFDALINAPGSGGFFMNNKTQSGPGGSVGLNFNGPAVDQANKTFRHGLRTDSGVGGFIFYDSMGNRNTNSGGAEPFPNLGTDLTNTHPVGMAIPRTDPQYIQILSNITIRSESDGHVPGSNKVFWLTKDGSLQPDVRDRLRAYPSDPSNPDIPYIECASCHNPHEASRPGGQPLPTDPVNAETINNSRFLRAPNPRQTGADMNDRNATSALCLSCHQK